MGEGKEEWRMEGLGEEGGQDGGEDAGLKVEGPGDSFCDFLTEIHINLLRNTHVQLF